MPDRWMISASWRTENEESSAWLEIEYTGDIIGNLREMLDEAMADSAMEPGLNRRVMDRVISGRGR